MFKMSLEERARQFFDELKEEIVKQAQRIQADTDGSIQDGLSLEHLPDGWVGYKGFSWGFALQREPVAMLLIFGPDGPFVGHKEVLHAQDMGGWIVWTNGDGDGVRPSEKFASPYALARYGIERLAAKVHDDVTMIFHEAPLYSQEEHPAV